MTNQKTKLLKILLKVTAIIFILTSYIIPSSQATTSENFFTDISENSKFYEAVKFAKESGIVKGYDDGSFRPENKITRAEFLKIVLLSTYTQDQIDIAKPQIPAFTDIGKSGENWFYNYAQFAFGANIINGYTDQTFRPNNNITLPEALKIIFKTKSIDSTKYKTDIWYDEFLDQAKEYNFLIPRGEITNDPKHEITRGEMVWMIYQLSKDTKSWWIPTPKTSWQWQLFGKINLTHDAEVYDIDLEETPQKTIDTLHQQGRKVICYFNGGAYEPYRSDSEKFPKEVLGKVMEGWEDEKWLDIGNYEKFAEIMTSRLDLAVSKKCDGVEPDNMDGFQNESGFPLSYNDQLKYNKWLANEAHKRGLAIGLKNDLDQIKDLINDFDFAINEQCFEYEECDLLSPFIDQNKAVFNAEYELEPEDFCDKAKEMKFSSLIMDYDLDGGRTTCS